MTPLSSTQPYSVSALNQLVQQVFQHVFSIIWVQGEISNFLCPTSGHWYFSLKDTVAQIRCVMFQYRCCHVNFLPKNGMQILVKARVSLYEARGEYQLLIEEIISIGEGALRLAFEKLKSRLLAEGLFDQKYKKSLPVLPKAVGIITSHTGSVIHDILSILKRRFPSLSVIIYPAAVQGEQAESQIIQMLNIANQKRQCDVLILARGGGSLEDLHVFNSEKIARSIFASKIPIVSAIGHETDVTIADFVADQRAATPSAAAELISPDGVVWKKNIEKYADRLTKSIYVLFDKYTYRLLSLSKRLRHPRQWIQHQGNCLARIKQRLHYAMQNQINNKKQRLAVQISYLEAMSPLATLARGYSITFLKSNKKIIRDIQEVNQGDTLITHLKTGKLFSNVIQTEK